MKTRLILLSLLLPLGAIQQAAAEETHPAASLLFVQSSKAIEYDKATKTLTLSGVGPSVTFFADRPKRLAGQLSVPGFIKIWNEGKDSFEKDPPNASLTSQVDGKAVNCVIELGTPKLAGDDLVYPVIQVISGTVPSKGGMSSLFIDGLLAPIFSGTRGQSALRTGAIGALTGSMNGDAGKGALIGAGIGLLGNAVTEGQ